MALKIKLSRPVETYKRVVPREPRLAKTGTILNAGSEFIFNRVAIVSFPVDSMHPRSMLALEGVELVLLKDVSPSLKFAEQDFEHLYKSYVSKKTQSGKNNLSTFWQRLAPMVYAELTSKPPHFRPKVNFDGLLEFVL